MLTVGSVLHQCQSVPAFVQSYSQSQARLMFVTALGMDNLDCTKMNAYLHSLSTGGAHSQVEVSTIITSPTWAEVHGASNACGSVPHTLFSFLLYCSVEPMIYCAF